jgi:hypothetical protein
MANSNYIWYGPTIPQNNKTFPIAYSAVKPPTPSDWISSFFTERYVIQNAPGIYTFTHQPSSLSVKSATASYSFEGASLPESGASKAGSFSGVSNFIKVSNGNLVFNVLNDPISISGVKILPGGAFSPVISKGIVWRFHTVTANEPPHSWLIRSGLKEGDDVLLGYTVPETHYRTLTAPPTSSVLLGDNTASLATETESVAVLDSITLKYSGDLEYLKSITVNNNILFEDFLAVDQSNNWVKSINPKNKTITLNKAVDQESDVDIQYLTLPDKYTYTGFRGLDPGGNIIWYPCDLNPTYGRVIKDYLTGVDYPSSVALLNQVLLYLVPSCYLKLSFSQVSEGVLDGSLTFESAFNYGETHFVRHHVGEIKEVFDEDLGQETDSFFNYWGVTPFNQAQYDEQGQAYIKDDIFSTFLPSMMPLVKFSLTGPDPQKVINLVDIRRKGGGLPEQFSQSTLNQHSSGLDYLRSFYDISIWEGDATIEGGHVTIQILNTVLNEFSKEQVEQMVKLHLPPGVSYSILYVESVS